MAKTTNATGPTNRYDTLVTFPIGMLPHEQSPTSPSETDGEDGAANASSPSRSARRAVWVAYADSLGVATAGLTRKQIITLVSG